MPQLQPTPDPRRRRGQAQLVPAEQQRQRRPRPPAPVPLQDERRRRRAGRPASKPRRGIPRLQVFLAGLGLGYGLNGPLPHMATALLAGLHHPSNLLGALITPAGMGERRIVVMGTDHVSTNTDVMFTVQLRDGRTELTQVPRDTFIDSSRYGVMK
ncbi:MAG: LytR family transcriptional regulator, partial [Vulcanococcus sp.]